MPRRRDDRPHAKVAKQRVDRLLDLAEHAALEGRFEDADRYAELAWKLTTRHTLEATNELKARVCRGCKRYLLPGKTARTRITEGKVTTTCQACGRTRRVPLTRERKRGRLSGDANEQGPSKDPAGE